MQKLIIGLGITLLLISSGAVQASAKWDAQDYDIYTGDFNGDGKADILYIAKDPSMPSGIALSDSNGDPTVAWQSWPSNFLGIQWASNAYKIIVADFNGDGKADIFLQSVGPGNNYLLLTSSAGKIVGISQTIPNRAMGLIWSADQHNIIAGDFNGDGRTDLFLQATSASGINAVVLVGSNGLFTATAPAQTWTDGYLGFKWSTESANVFAGDFNDDGLADLLIQAKPEYVMVHPNDAFPTATYPPNMNGVVLAQSTAPIFSAVGAQAWSRMSNGVDWSPLTNNVVIGMSGTRQAVVILQDIASGSKIYRLIGNRSGALFSSGATALSSNVALSGGVYRLLAGKFKGGSGVGLYLHSLTAGGKSYVTSTVGDTMTVTVDKPLSSGSPVAPTSAGRTAGQFSITPTGSVSYNIPIWTPPGARDIEPHLALHYTSGGPDGVMGPGWSITGMSAIVRCNKTWASNNGNPAPVTLAATDDLCIDGNRLRLIGGTQGMAGSTYFTELADFSLITANGSSGVATSFTVLGKDGRYYEYGNTNVSVNSQVTAAGSSAPYVWALDKVSDRQSNSMVYQYDGGNTTLTLSTIQYTATSAAPSTFYYTVQFNYQPRTGGTTLTKYVAGGTVTQSNELISIQVSSLSPSALVRQYNIYYTTSPTTNRPQLTSVQECGVGGSDCIRPTTITYQPGAAGWSTTAVSTGLGALKYGFLSVDLNGDGIPDALYGKLNGSSIHWYAKLGTGSGYGSTEYDTGANTASGQTIIPGAFNGTEKIQFLAPVNGVWCLYSFNGSGFGTCATTKLTVNGEVEAVDYDGDGLPDLVALSGKSILVRRNTTLPGGSVSFASPTTVYTTTLPYDLMNLPLSTMDINGDGRADFVFQYQACSQGNCRNKSLVVLSNGFGSQATGLAIAVSTDYGFTTGDWNGDGCTDLITAQNIYLSDCTGGFTTIPTGAPSTAGSPLAIDWDGDGQTDLVYEDPSFQLMLVRSTGSGAAAPVPLHISTSSTQSFFVFDKNSDGQPEIGMIDSSTNIVSYYPHNGFDNPPDLASEIADGFGIYFEPTYVPISQSNYAKGNQAEFPDEDFDGPMYVVNSFTASDGTGGTYSASFSYAGARLNLQGRGFEGFASTSALDSRNGLYHNTGYSQAFPTIGAVVEDDIQQSVGSSNFISKTTNSYLVAQLNAVPLDGYTPPGSGTACPTSCFPYLSSTVINKYEAGGAKDGAWISNANTQYTYDGGGSVASTTSTLTDEDSVIAPISPYAGQQWTTIIANTIYNNNSTNVWCLGRPTVTTSKNTAPGQPTLTRTVDHTMDASTGGLYGTAYGNCRAQIETVEPSSPLTVTTTFGFDACGNTNSVSVVGLDETGAAMPARTTTTSYNVYTSRCQFPESATNPYNQTSYVHYRYDLGLKSSATDANDVSVSWLYDDFGRKTQENRPDKTYTTWSYTDCVAASCWGYADLRFETTETLYSNLGLSYRVHDTFVDGLDRLRGDYGNRVLGALNLQINTYDSLGRKTEATLPYSSGSNGYHIYSYDVGNRPLSDTLYTTTGAVYRTITLGYLGQTAAVTYPQPNNSGGTVTTTKVTDVAGNLRQVTDPAEGIHGAAAGTTKYTYDSFKNLIEIDDANTPSNKSTYSYNIRGFKIGAVDADTGMWSFQPDSLNELKVQKDASTPAKVTTFTYDLMGRMLTRLEPESTTPTSWVYGTSASAHEIGQLHSVSKPDGYAESYLYGSDDRPQTKFITEDGNNYEFDYAYSSYGSIGAVTYPVSTSGYRFKLEYVYDAWGYLNSTQDAVAGTVFWTLTGANDGNAPTAEVLGNGASVYTGYTAWTNEMISRTEGSGSSQNNLENLSYSWDLNGNLQSRKDNIQNLTEAFVLDNLNRLSSVTLNGAQTLSVTYDQAGDITSKSDVGAYTYGNAAHPHAVTQAGSYAIGYDANGNMNSRAGGSITSYSYNLPNTIDLNSSSAQFNYDSNHQRWKQVASYSGTTETIHYIGGLLQIVTHGTSPTEYRHQIPAGSSTAAYTRRTDGTTGTYYATSDHLGSADLVMDGAANVLVKESFSPFGARRGSNWQGLPSSSDFTAFQTTTRQGFTGHEMLDAVELVHMNGRVYDPTLGRFLSADSVIQSLGTTQSINPYSYAWNDPLRYTDPSGHGFWDFVSTILSVAQVVVAAVLSYFTFGALGGGLWGAIGAGFVGGFTGAFIATGSLSAALMSGLIGAVVGGLFYEAGSFADIQNWDTGERMLAHAAVGCAQGASSSGNCGKSAFAAALTEGVARSGLIPAKAYGDPGALKATIEAGIVGGFAARIVGGKFVDGFSVAAAGYLFNTTAHEMKQYADSMMPSSPDPDMGGPAQHQYATDTIQICSSNDAECTLSNVRASMAATQVPGYSGTVVDGGVYPVTIPGLGYIGDAQVSFEGDNIINNETLPGHLLYYGFVSRVATIDASGINLTTYGYGTNIGGPLVAAANTIFGANLFNQQDQVTKQYYTLHYH